jgi:RNA polymerase-binding transcription factor DksA
MYLSGKIHRGCASTGRPKKIDTPEVLPAPIVEDTTEYEDTIPDAIEADLQKWRMASRIGKRTLVGVSDADGYSKWVMDSRTKLTEPLEIFPDKERMPWLSFKSIAEVIEKADVDEEELAYLIYVCGHDAMASIVICRENTESESAAQADEIDKLKKEIKSLKSEINSQYCHECGERISEEFLKTHPGTKYCVNCYDKH